MGDMPIGSCKECESTIYLFRDRINDITDIGMYKCIFCHEIMEERDFTTEVKSKPLKKR